MPREPRRPCVICQKQCEAHQRNVDGTYVHDECSKRATITQGWDRPIGPLGSTDAKEEKKW